MSGGVLLTLLWLCGRRIGAVVVPSTVKQQGSPLNTGYRKGAHSQPSNYAVCIARTMMLFVQCCMSEANTMVCALL